MEQQLAKKSLNSPCSILAVIFALAFLDLVLIARGLFFNLRCLFARPDLSGLGRIKDPTLKCLESQPLPARESRVERILDGESAGDVKLSGVEVEQVMEKLRIFGNREVDDRLPDYVGASQIVGLFDEREPSLEEVKEAFEVFDRNHDGFIDATELCSFLCTFGFSQISEDDCRDMIRAFDNNGDNLVDLREFTKLVEKSLH